MNTETNNNYRFENLAINSRIVRLITAVLFIGTIMATTGPVGNLVLLPLIAIYLTATALVGWSPVRELFHHKKQGAKKLTPSLRAGYGVLGASLIGSVMLTSATPLGWLAVLPLIAVYPAIGAITGIDILDAIFNNGQIQDDEKPEITRADIHHFDVAKQAFENQSKTDQLHGHDKAA